MKALLNIIFPEKCAGCGEKSSYLCLSCRKKIPALSVQLLSKENIFSLYPYRNEIIKKLLFQLKFKHIKDIAFVFGEPLHNFIFKEFQEDFPIYLLPIPQTKIHAKKRGFNQAHALAEAIAAHNKNYFIKDILVRKDVVSAQTSFKSRKDRENNMRDGFFIENGEFLKNNTVVIIDDIVTTGSTMRAGKRALEKFSPKKISCISVAYQELS